MSRVLDISRVSDQARGLPGSVGRYGASLLSGVSSNTGCRCASARKYSTAESLLAWKYGRVALAMPM